MSRQGEEIETGRWRGTTDGKRRKSGLGSLECSGGRRRSRTSGFSVYFSFVSGVDLICG